jgi:hypothetical protein
MFCWASTDVLVVNFNLLSHTVPVGTEVTHERSSWDFIDAVFPSHAQHTAHEKAICITHRHTILQETEKNSVDQHVTFLWKCKTSHFFFLGGHNILTEAMFVRQLFSNAGMSVLNCVGYDKLQLHERYSTEVACRWQRMPGLGSNVSMSSRQRSQEVQFAPRWYFAADEGDRTADLCVLLCQPARQEQEPIRYNFNTGSAKFWDTKICTINFLHKARVL